MSDRILFVDDDPNLLAGCKRSLRREFVIDTALGGDQGLEMINTQPPYAVVVADTRMRNMDGNEFLIKAKVKAPDTIRVVLTGIADPKTARDAVNHGHIFRLLIKPCPPEELVLVLKAGLKQFQMVRAERELLASTLSGRVKPLTVTRMVTLQELHAGCILKAGLFAKDGRLIVPAATEISPMLLEKLRIFALLGGIKEPIYIQDR